MGRPSGKPLYIEEIRRRYCDNKESLGEISRALGISVQTLSRWMQEDGIALEARPRNSNAGRAPQEQKEINKRISAARTGKGTGPRAARSAIRCERCEVEFVPSTSRQRFCSRACARHVERDQKLAANALEWLESASSLCPCGQNRIPYASRHVMKYCSSECRQQYGLKKGPARNEANYITFDCQNCEMTVTRRRTYGAAFKYCSNNCARRHTKAKKHFTVDGTTVLDSGYEVFFWGLCAVLKIPIRRYDRDQGVQWREDRWYAPDFIISIRGAEYPVEIKGVQDDHDEERWAAFRGARGPLIVLDGEDLKRWAAGRGEVMDSLQASAEPDFVVS